MADDLTDGARHLSLERPLAPRIKRQSTVESAAQAGGIFDLYGSGRDSWRGESTPQTSPNQASGGYREDGPMEELNSPGPETTLANGNSRLSSTSTAVAPPITVTGPNTPERLADQRSSTFTSLSSNACSPTHPSISRLSPRRPGTGSSSASTSQVSISGSSQYPGEENDAFHVRSTCMSCPP